MTKQINIRISEELYQKLKDKEHDFGAIGLSHSVRRLIEVAFHLTDEMEQHDKLQLAIKVMLENKKDA